MCLYGGNAAGKTNILHALNLSLSIIKKSLRYQEGDKIPYAPFKLNDKIGKNGTKYELIFEHAGNRYDYGFSHNVWEVIEEYLYYYPNGRQSVIFNREKNKYRFTKDQKELDILSKRTIKNRLFIATATEWNYEMIKKPFSYLNRNFVFNDNIEPENPSWSNYTYKQMLNNEELKRKILFILKQINSDIDDFEIDFEKKTFQDNDIPIGLPTELKNLLLNRSGEVSKISTLHLNSERTKLIHFELSEESRGIRKFMEFIGPWLDILEKGRCLFIDELETSLHPFIVKYLIQLFLNPKINKHNGQLLFTTHDTNLLDLSLFRRDQIWFVEKDKDKCSDFYSLSDLKGVRKDENIKSGYLRGKYGAIPFSCIDLKDFENV